MKTSSTRKRPKMLVSKGVYYCNSPSIPTAQSVMPKSFAV